MLGSPDAILTLTVGGSAIGRNLQGAIDSGAVVQRADGLLELPRRSPGDTTWLVCGTMPNCVFLNRFMFQRVYAERAVPKGCELCYKIKVMPRTLRELVALYGIAQKLECPSKCGIDFYNRHSQHVYAGYFYFRGLDAARGMLPVIRRLMDSDPKLGAGVPALIKRGCSNYEAACGPSDQYAFKPELEAIEAYLERRFHHERRERGIAAEVIYRTWVPFAYQIGDDTYLDFTGGKPLYPKSVTYDQG